MEFFHESKFCQLKQKIVKVNFIYFISVKKNSYLNSKNFSQYK